MFDSGDQAYDAFMGRYSQPLSALFADVVQIGPGTRVLDVGCGPGALTAESVSRAADVTAIDPTAAFVEACRRRHPGVDVRRGGAEHLPFDDESFDCAAAQLVLHFVDNPEAAAAEMTRVVRHGGVVAGCMWDFAEGMQMLRSFWDAALTVDPAAPDEARALRFGGEGELAELFRTAGLRDVTETTLTVSTSYLDFDELWAGFLGGVGPAGSYCVGLPAQQQRDVRDRLYDRLERPAGGFSLQAVARAARGVRQRSA